MTHHRAALAAAAVLFPALAAAAPVALSLGAGGSSLVRLGDVSTPGKTKTLFLTDSMTRAAVRLTDLDFEKETNTLFGVSAVDDAVYSINPANGVATRRANLPAPSAADVVAVDFNNAIDLLRIVTSTGENFVFNPTLNTVVTATPLAYGAADPNAGTAPAVFADAYRAAIPGNLPEGAMQFGFDAATDSFVMLANNLGTLTTVADIGFDVDTTGGFDIFSTGASSLDLVDTGFALLTRVDGTSPMLGLYSFSLPVASGGPLGLTLLRDLTGEGLSDLRGLAVIDSADLPAPIPLPAPLALLAGGFAALAGLRRLAR